MELIDTSAPPSGDPICREMNWHEKIISRIGYKLTRLRRKLPHLVWYGDELDVTVTFSQHRLPEGVGIDEAVSYLYRSRMAEIEQAISDIGISFDRGGGYDGRDWEWDWSLKGPISIRFRHRATKPERRMERPKPKLVCAK